VATVSTDSPLPKPDHLAPPPGRAAAVVALALGVLAFVMSAAVRDHVWAATDLRIGLPGFLLTAVAAGISVLRRERAYGFALAGVGLAGAGLVLGWFLMFAIVLGATALVIGILHHIL
jgi:hypothetical protein